MRSNASPERIAALLAASFLEAAWVTLAYVLIESLTRAAEAPLSMLAFAAATLVGTVFARWAARGDPHAHRTLVAVIAIAVGLIGWLLPLGPAATGVLEDPAIVFAMHPGGILLGLAFVRGTAHRTDLDDERIAEAALGPGLAAVAGLWVLLAASGGTATGWVVNAATWATVTFVTTALLSIGLARLADLRGAGVRGADRRIWDGVLVGVVVGARGRRAPARDGPWRSRWAEPFGALPRRSHRSSSLPRRRSSGSGRSSPGSSISRSSSCAAPPVARRLTLGRSSTFRSSISRDCLDPGIGATSFSAWSPSSWRSSLHSSWSERSSGGHARRWSMAP